MVSLINTIDTGHEDMIHNAVLDYYGMHLATCSSDGSVKIFDVKNGNQVLVADLKGHQGPVWQVAWAHPKFGNILASCSYDRKVIVWKEGGANDWTKIYEYSNHDSSVNSVAFAPAEYGLMLACGSSDGSISALSCNTEYGVWDCKKIPNAHTIGCNAVTWCPSTVPEPAFDQKSSTRNTGIKRLSSGGCDNCVKIWREESDRWVEESRLEAHSDWVRDVAWAPSIGLPRSQIASASQDRHVIIWNSTDFTTWSPTILHTFDDVVWSVSWSMTGNILAVTGGDNKVTLWKENNENQWTCINDDASVAGGQQSDQRTL
ncbi:nuclear pore and COPII coat complex component secretory 13 [Haematobia irritans]|uniref:nuclear pore and COPII coat complex component secretory 13 n=1 Tax=Haematobia irritans TaxID=7368 RepID=UPI003F4F733E